MGRKRNERHKIRIETTTTPKDLAFTTSWFMGCFMNNVTRLRYEMKLVETHPVNYRAVPEKQQLELNWRSENGTAGCTIAFGVQGSASILQWFGTDPVLKQQLENVWNQCIQQIERAWEAFKK
jgi:hypothetical protein